MNPRYSRYIGVFLMVISLYGLYGWYTRQGNILAVYLGSSMSFLIELGMLFAGFWLLGHEFIKPKKATKVVEHSWNARLIYVPIILLLIGLVYGTYSSSNKDSPLYKVPANIEESCVMNGFGEGSCSFTNRGEGKGYMCGYVLLKRTDGKSGEAKSSKVCSGDMGGHSTIKQDFTIVNTQDVCKATLPETWKDVCGFEFIRENG